MPQRLDPNTMDTITIVLSSLSDSLENQLKEYYTITFGKNEHLFLQADSLLSNGARGAADKIEELVDGALLSGKMTHLNPMRTNLVLYATLDSETADRIQHLRDTVSAIGKRLGVSINTYACILKQQKNGEEYAGYMDRCVEICAGREATADGASRLPIPILIIDRGIGIALDLPLKATVRYLHVISRSSILKTVLAGNTELVMNISMMEFDDEDAASIQNQIRDHEDELNTKESSKRQMVEAAQSQIDEGSQRLTQKDLMRLQQFPIRADAIGNLFSVLFFRSRLKHALRDVAVSFARAYEKNVHERYCIGCLDDEDSVIKVEQMLASLPVSYVRSRMIPDLEELGKRFTPKYEAYLPELRICLGEKKLRAQLEEQYQKALDRSRSYIKHVVVLELKKQVAAYISTGRLDQREEEIKERILRLKAKARAVGSAQSVTDFLMTLLTYLQTQGGVTFRNRTSCDSIMLVSQRIDDDWNQYKSFMPNTPVFDVYNYGILEEQELQALQIMRFDADCYRKNRGLMFQIGED